jgi:hypothetical protein
MKIKNKIIDLIFYTFYLLEFIINKKNRNSLNNIFLLHIYYY